MTVADEFWAQALRECEQGIRNDALWAKAYVAATGDEQLAKVGYLRERANQLAEEAANKAALAEAATAKCRAEAARIQVEAAERVKPFIDAFRGGRNLTTQELQALVIRSGEDRTLLYERDRLRGRTLTHLCASANMLSEVKALLRFGADPTAPDGNGRPPTLPDGTPVSAL